MSWTKGYREKEKEGGGRGIRRQGHGVARTVAEENTSREEDREIVEGKKEGEGGGCKHKQKRGGMRKKKKN